jgi:hypothetical protein
MTSWVIAITMFLHSGDMVRLEVPVKNQKECAVVLNRILKGGKPEWNGLFIQCARKGE